MFRRFRQQDKSSPQKQPSAPAQQAASPIATVLGPGATINGALHVPHGARVDGSLEGSLEVKGPLVIGETARIVADIKAKAVSVAGTVKGNVTAEQVEILSTGRIYGDLITSGFSTEEGGFLRGTVQMTDPDQVAEEASKEVSEADSPDDSAE